MTAYGALSLETNSSCLHRQRIDGSHHPVGRLQTSASLTPATGARTTRFCRTHQRQSSARCVRSRTKARPANTTTRQTLPRPPQPAPTFVTMANAPLPGRDGASCRGDLGWQRRSIFLPMRLDWANHVDLAMKIWRSAQGVTVGRFDRVADVGSPYPSAPDTASVHGLLVSPSRG